MKAARADDVVDWAALRARLDDVNAAVERALTPPPERVARILARRAERLAESAEVRAPAGDRRDVLVFELAGEKVALETRFVGEVVVPRHLSRVPRGPEWLVGVLNLRGRTLPAVDLRRVLGLGAATRGGDAERLLILGEEQSAIAALVEKVQDLLTVDMAGSEARSAALELDDSHVLGVTQDALVVLDGAAVLADPQLSA